MATTAHLNVIDSARFFVHHVLDRVARWVAPNDVKAVNLVNGFYGANISAAIVGLDIPGALADGPRTTEELASALNIDQDRLLRLLTAARVVGLVKFKKRQNRWAAKPVLSALQSGSIHALYALYLTIPSRSAPWGLLEYIVRSGENGFRVVNGKSMWEWFDEHDLDAELYSLVLDSTVGLDVAMMSSVYQFPTTGKVCDVGGAGGAQLAHLLTLQPGLRGILFDRPKTVEAAKKNFEGGLAKRMSFVAGDMFESFKVNADLYLIKSVLHNWSDERCVGLLRAIREAASPGAKILIIELFLNRKEPSREVAFADLEVMVTCDQGRERTVPELHGLLRSAGFKPGAVVRTQTGLVLVEGVV